MIGSPLDDGELPVGLCSVLLPSLKDRETPPGNFGGEQKARYDEDCAVPGLASVFHEGCFVRV